MLPPGDSRQHRRCIVPQSSAPEDGRNHRPKHVEPIEIINKLPVLHLVVCLHYYINDARPHNYQRQYNTLHAELLRLQTRTKDT